MRDSGHQNSSGRKKGKPTQIHTGGRQLECNCDRVEVISLLNPVRPAVQDGVRGRLRRLSSTTAGIEGRDIDRLSVLQHAIGIQILVDSKEIVYADSVRAGNSSNEVSSDNLVHPAPLSCLVRVSTLLRPLRKFHEHAWLENTGGSGDIGVDAGKHVPENVKTVGDRLHRVTLLGDIDLAVRLVVEVPDIYTSRLLGAREADEAANLQEACKVGGVSVWLAIHDGRHELFRGEDVILLLDAVQTVTLLHNVGRAHSC